MSQERRTYLGIPLNPESGDEPSPLDMVRLAAHLEMSTDDLTAMLEETEGTAALSLSEQAKARLSRVAQVTILAEEFLGDTALTWLRTPRASLSTSGMAITPLALSLQEGGLDHLRSHFLQLRHGISP